MTTPATGSRRLVPKRTRAPLACNACRQTKSKCDSERPACGRCKRLQYPCIYTQNNAPDKRLGSQKERRARWARVVKTEPPRKSGSVLMAKPEIDGPSASTPASSSAISSGSAIDMVATGAFDNRPAIDVGHFGPSSNFALYQSLTQAISSLCQQMAIAASEPLETIDSDLRKSSVHTKQTTSASPVVLSSVHQPGRWIPEFLDGVGAVLLFVDKTLIRASATTRSAQALLNIVDAHTRASSDDATTAELHYHQALQLLLADEQEVGHARVETVQALLLLASYQQNSQRAMASLTSHVLAVKAAYQLGLHCRASYAGLRPSEQQLRARLWYGVVNQDITLSSALGRPCLVPSQHVRPAIFTLLTADPSLSSSSSSSTRYFCSLISLHEIIAAAVDSIYDANVGSPLDLLSADLIAKTTSLLDRLTQWRANVCISSFGFLDETIALDSWTPPRFHAERYRLLLALYSCKAVMIVCGPILMAALRETSAARTGMRPSAVPDILRDASASIFQSDLHALHEFQRILNAILVHDPSFIRRNAVWWMSNFTSFTMCLHLLALWILCICSPLSMPRMLNLAAGQAEARLLDGLQTLKIIGESSIMSVHAHRRLQQYLVLVRLLGKNGKIRTDADAGASAGAAVNNTTSTRTVGADRLLTLHDMQRFLPSGTVASVGLPSITNTDPVVPSLEDLFCQLGDNDLFDKDATFPPHLDDTGGFLP